MSIAYIEKGQGLHDALAAHGFFLVEEYAGGVSTWVLHRTDNLTPSENDCAAAQSIIDGYDALGSARAAAIIKVKAVAQDLIYGIAPAWKQSNLIARSVELINLRAVNGYLEEGEQAELDGNTATWDHIKSIRVHSNTLEAWVAGADATALASFNVASPPAGLAWPS